MPHASVSWDSAAEADQYFEEALWAFKWKLYPEAQEAAETAWALGRRTRDTALLRIRSHVKDQAFSAEPDFLNLSDPPDAAKLPGCIRALELFQTDAVFLPTNGAPHDLEWFDLGLDVLGISVRMLKGFHDVAEARPGQEERLADLRALARQIAPVVETNGPSHRGIRGIKLSQEDPSRGGLGFARMAWLGGGLWFEKPEDALPMFRELVEAGLNPSELPGLCGWTWEDRKRIPGLTAKFIDDLCGSTHPRVRLEGRYLAMLRAPLDEAGSLQLREDELLAEIWEQRAEVLTKRPSILWRTERALRRKHNVSSGPFTVEPLPGFQHRLRKEYFATITSYNDRFDSIDPVVVQCLFSQNANSKAIEFKPEEARELLPLMVAFRKRVDRPDGKTSSLAYWLRSLKAATDRLPATDAVAGTGGTGLARPKPSENPSSTALTNLSPIGAASMEEAEFIPWKLQVQRRRPPVSESPVQSVVLRQGRIWAQIKSWLNPFDPRDVDFSFVGVDPRSGSMVVVPFPKSLGVPDPVWTTGSRPFFEVTAEALLVSVQERLARYRFKDGDWDVVPVPMENGARITAVEGKLHLSTLDSLLRMPDSTGPAEVIASSRRRPAVNNLDPLSGFTMVYRRAPGIAGVLTVSKLFDLESDGRIRSEISLLPQGRQSRLVRMKVVENGAILKLTGLEHRHRLVGVWNGRTNVEALMEQRVHRFAPAVEELDASLPPVRWQWPTNYVLRAVEPVAGGKDLWLLHPKPGPLQNGTGDGYPPAVGGLDDGRSATLLVFATDEATPSDLALRLKKDGQRFDLFRGSEKNPEGAEFREPFCELTDDALLLVNHDMLGHWRFPVTALRARLEMARPSRPSSNSVAPASGAKVSGETRP